MHIIIITSMICHRHLNFPMYFFLLMMPNCKSISQFNDSQLLQHNLHNLHHRSLKNHLGFNISKCVSLSFHHKFSTKYNIDSQLLPLLDFHCDLRVLLFSNLSWNAHLNHIFPPKHAGLWPTASYFC